jgi:anti-sigma factor RsiW
VSCQETQDLIHGYIDGELDLVRNLEIERHLQACQTCSQAHRDQQALRSAVATGSLYYHAPASLQTRVRSAVREANKHEVFPPIMSWKMLRIMSWRRLSVGASLAAVAILALILAPILTRPSADELMAREIVSAHVRSLMATHLTDVSSSDQHTVKPWFNGKLDFSPSVKDLTNQGFPLVGGRLDYINDRPVAALVYRRQQHFINLFIWPSAQGSEKAKTEPAPRQGYHLFRWTTSGMTYWAVSDLNERELKEFVQLAHNQTSPTATP